MRKAKKKEAEEGDRGSTNGSTGSGVAGKLCKERYRQAQHIPAGRTYVG